MGFNMNAPDPGLVPVGTYLAEISEVSTRSSKKSGDAMWLVTWKRVDTRERLAQDVWMLEGKGAAMTKKRLKFLGFKTEDGEVDGHQLLGKRAHLAICHEEYAGELQAKVDSKADDSCFGMFPEPDTGGADFPSFGLEGGSYDIPPAKKPNSSDAPF